MSDFLIFLYIKSTKPISATELGGNCQQQNAWSAARARARNLARNEGSPPFTPLSTTSFMDDQDDSHARASLSIKQLLARRPPLGPKAKPQPLAKDQHEKCRTEQQVSAPQAARLRGQTEQPFKAEVLDPVRGLCQRARDERKCGAYGHNGQT